MQRENVGIRTPEDIAAHRGVDETFAHSWNRITVESWMWDPQGLGLRLGSPELLAFAEVYGRSHHDGGEFQRSYQSIADLIGVKRRQSINVFKNLMDAGLIRPIGRMPWTGRDNSFVMCYKVDQDAVEKKLGPTRLPASPGGDDLVLREWMWDKDGLGLKVSSLPICVYSRIYDATRIDGGLGVENQGKFAMLLGVDQAQLSRALTLLRTRGYIGEGKTEYRYGKVYTASDEAIAAACSRLVYGSTIDVENHQGASAIFSKPANDASAISTKQPVDPSAIFTKPEVETGAIFTKPNDVENQNAVSTCEMLKTPEFSTIGDGEMLPPSRDKGILTIKNEEPENCTLSPEANGSEKDDRGIPFVDDATARAAAGIRREPANGGKGLSIKRKVAYAKAFLPASVHADFLLLVDRSKSWKGIDLEGARATALEYADLLRDGYTPDDIMEAWLDFLDVFFGGREYDFEKDVKNSSNPRLPFARWFLTWPEGARMYLRLNGHRRHGQKASSPVSSAALRERWATGGTALTDAEKSGAKVGVACGAGAGDVAVVISQNESYLFRWPDALAADAGKDDVRAWAFSEVERAREAALRAAGDNGSAAA